MLVVVFKPLKGFKDKWVLEFYFVDSLLNYSHLMVCLLDGSQKEETIH